MDEPLLNLDAQVRVMAREELKQLQRDLKPTIIYVTHDQVEALSLATKLAVLHDGVIQAYGDPIDVYKRPNNVWVGKFLGNPPMNILKGEIEGDSVIVEGYKLGIPEQYKSLVKEIKKVYVGIRPEDMEITNNGLIEGTVEMVEDLGSYSIIHVKINESIVRIIEKSMYRRERGEKVKINIETSKIVLFDGTTEANLLFEQSTNLVKG